MPPADGDTSTQSSKIGRHEPDQSKTPATHETIDISSWDPLKFLDFNSYMEAWHLLFYDFAEDRLYRELWMQAQNLAVRNLPQGGLIGIPMSSSTDDRTTRANLQLVNNNRFPRGKTELLNSLEKSSYPHPDQSACWNWAEIGWRNWLEYEYKPRLVVFESKRFQNKGTYWPKDDMLGFHGEGTVKIWFSEHLASDPLRPALLSAELHIILNSMFPFNEQSTDPILMGRPETAHSMAIIGQHISPFRQRIHPPELDSPPFYYRFSMFKATDQMDTFLWADIFQRRDKGRFPATGSAANPVVPRKSWFCENYTSIVAIFKDARDGNTLRDIFVIQDKDWENFSAHRIPENVYEELSLMERSRFLPTLLRQYHVLWEDSWNGCLDGIDDSVKITLEDLSDDTKLDTFMFDGTNFERSRSYFAALQLLRIFSDRIKETRQDLIQAIKALGQDVSLFELTGLEEAESRLLQRIDRKTEEIKTLRDGLFNSTSVREATRATQMNRYVIVFTVVTVLYAPPSFISALFATPLPYFTKGDPDDFKRAVGIATGTTVLAAMILLVIANSFDDVVRNPKDRLMSMVESTRTRGRSIVAQSQSFTRVPFRTVQEAGRALREFAGKAVERVGRAGQRGTQNTAPQQSRGQTEHRHHGQDIDLPDRTANAATPPRNDHGGNIV